MGASNGSHPDFVLRGPRWMRPSDNVEKIQSMGYAYVSLEVPLYSRRFVDLVAGGERRDGCERREKFIIRFRS